MLGKFRPFLIAFAFIFSSLFATSSFASEVHGVFKVVKGKVELKSAKDGQIKKARVGRKVFPEDTIITGKDSRAKIVMSDKNEINVSPDSNLVIEKYEFDPKQKKKNVLLNVIYGKVRNKVNQKYDGDKNKFQVKTPTAVAGVRGTDFLAGFNPKQKTSEVVTFEGEVEFGQPGPGGKIKNSVRVRVGQATKSVAGGSPEAPRKVSSTELASLDQESSAESSEGSSEERSPTSSSEEDEGGEEEDAGEESKEQEEGAQEESKEENDSAQTEDDGKNNEGESKEASQSENQGEGDSGGADADLASSDDPGAKEGPGEGGGEGQREPSSLGPGGDSPAADSGSGDMSDMFMADDLAGSDDGNLMIAPDEGFNTVLPPPIPTFTDTPACDYCNRVIEETGEKSLVIRVNN